MSPPISYTKKTLSYPIFAADFDPYGRGYLLVGGGGGESRTGVGNKITLLDTSKRNELTVAAEIELSRDEDSVMSLASLATKDGLIVYSGVNSGNNDRAKGKNEHFRSFEVTYPPRPKPGKDGVAAEKSETVLEGKISPIGRSILFAEPATDKDETYQRIIRLSPAQRRESGSKRIGAVATGSATKSEVVVFEATKATPDASSVIARIYPPEGSEAADLDVTEPSEGNFAIAYCTDYEVYFGQFAYKFLGKASVPAPRKVYSIPFPDVFDKPVRQKFRAVRFLTPEFLLLVSNLPGRTGAELHIMRVYESGPGSIVFAKRLPKRIKAATGMDVCALDADKAGNRQFVIAIAGQDISMTILTINYTGSSKSFDRFYTFSTVRDIHPVQMTKITFAPFRPFPRSAEGKAPAQYIRLASTSMGNTVVVDTMALIPLKAEDKESRYVLSHPRNEKVQRYGVPFIVTLILLVSAILIQAMFFPAPEGSSSGLGRFLPPGARQFIPKAPSPTSPSVGSSSALIPVPPTDAPEAVPSLLSPDQATTQETKKAFVMQREHPDAHPTMEVHADADHYLLNADSKEEQDHAKSWDDLEHREKERWKERLVDAGEWTADMGETILKSWLFSEWGGLVVRAALG